MLFVHCVMAVELLNETASVQAGAARLGLVWIRKLLPAGAKAVNQFPAPVDLQSEQWDDDIRFKNNSSGADNFKPAIKERGT